MKISKLIDTLTTAKQTEGDLDISVFSGKGVKVDFELQSGVYIRKQNKKTGKWESVNTLCFSAVENE